MATTDFQVIFPPWYDERGEWEAEAKGWLQGVAVRLPSGETQPLFFYDPVRLAQDVQEGAADGTFVACPGLIVVPKITRQSILDSVRKLVNEGYLPIQQPPAGWSPNDVIHTIA